ncbi:hypothetical protein Trco_001607 [Trichoderma cornu-damae]|uniref:Uncharacterized protein n=1 Tax=Trichoderma cornu-damae TaxID=654480 RepID=A0A9P8U121_9HYPO|nr:hypothetical protein Trco_001607 [Trichoderma cornu-damae]
MCFYPTSSDLKARILRFPNSLKFATWWSCGIYSRAWTRLELASLNQDAEDLPNIRLCNSDCLQFALCLPFYGFFLGSLQNAVRSYYGIDGDDIQDFCDGCCSPCTTLVRNEQESILRERARKAEGGHATDGEREKQYLCYNPMAYPNKSELASSAARGDTLLKEQTNTNPCEDLVISSEAAVKVSPAKVHSLDAHAQTTRSSRRTLHSLEDDLATPRRVDDLATPGRVRPREHILHDDPEIITLARPAGAVIAVKSSFRLSLESRDCYFDAPD